MVGIFTFSVSIISNSADQLNVPCRRLSATHQAAGLVTKYFIYFNIDVKISELFKKFSVHCIYIISTDLERLFNQKENCEDERRGAYVCWNGNSYLPVTTTVSLYLYFLYLFLPSF